MRRFTALVAAASLTVGSFTLLGCSNDRDTDEGTPDNSAMRSSDNYNSSGRSNYDTGRSSSGNMSGSSNYNNTGSNTPSGASGGSTGTSGGTSR